MRTVISICTRLAARRGMRSGLDGEPMRSGRNRATMQRSNARLICTSRPLSGRPGLAGCAAPGTRPRRPPPHDLTVPYTQFTLPNGLHVILHQDNTVPVVAVNVWYHVGSGDEKPGRTGFAHLFEHLMFEGSEHVPEGDFDTWLEGAGGDNNGSTTERPHELLIDVPRNALELALFLESDRMGFLLDR